MKVYTQINVSSNTHQQNGIVRVCCCGVWRTHSN